MFKFVALVMLAGCTNTGVLGEEAPYGPDVAFLSHAPHLRPAHVDYAAPLFHSGYDNNAPVVHAPLVEEHGDPSAGYLLGQATSYQNAFRHNTPIGYHAVNPLAAGTGELTPLPYETTGSVFKTPVAAVTPNHGVRVEDAVQLGHGRGLHGVALPQDISPGHIYDHGFNQQDHTIGSAHGGLVHTTLNYAPAVPALHTTSLNHATSLDHGDKLAYGVGLINDVNDVGYARRNEWNFGDYGLHQDQLYTEAFVKTR